MILQEAMQQNVMPKASDIIEGKESLDSIKQKVFKSKGSGCKKPGCCQKKAIQKEWFI